MRPVKCRRGPVQPTLSISSVKCEHLNCFDVTRGADSKPAQGSSCKMSKQPAATESALLLRGPYSEMNQHTALLLRDSTPPPLSALQHPQPTPSVAIKTSTTTPPEARAQAQAQTHLLPLLHRHTQTQHAHRHRRV